MIFTHIYNVSLFFVWDKIYVEVLVLLCDLFLLGGGGGIVYITHGGFCSQIVHMVFGLGIAGSQNFLTVNSQVSKEAEYPGFVG